jgi:hypothetical protein
MVEDEGERATWQRRFQQISRVAIAGSHVQRVSGRDGNSRPASQL